MKTALRATSFPPAGFLRHEVPARHARAALHRCLGERASYVTGNLYACISNSRKLFSGGRAALLSRTSATSFMASPPLAASVHACLHGRKDCLGHAGGEVQCTNTLSVRYLRLNRSLKAAGVAAAVIEAPAKALKLSLPTRGRREHRADSVRQNCQLISLGPVATVDEWRRLHALPEGCFTHFAPSGVKWAAAPETLSVVFFHSCQQYYPFLLLGLWASAACPSACASARRAVHQARQIHQPDLFISYDIISHPPW